MLTYNRYSINKKNIEYLKKYYVNYEIIVIDNNSTDNTKSYLKTIDGIKVILLDKNMGVAYARNIGAQNATGDILVFIDNDIFIQFNFAEVDYLFNQNSKLSVIGGKILSSNYQIDTWVYKLSKTKYSDKVFSTYYFAGGAAMIRRIAFNEVDGFSNDLFFTQEERDISLKLLDKGYDIIYHPKCVFMHEHIAEKKIIGKSRFKYNFINLMITYYKYFPYIFIYLFFFVELIKNIIVSFKYNYVQTYFESILIIAKKIRKIKRSPIKFNTVILYLKLKYKFKEYNEKE